MKLLGSTISKITKDGNDKNVHLEVIEVILVHCNIFNNDYQHDSRILYTFVPNKPFGQLLDISLLQKGQFRITAEATGDLIGDKVNNTITKILFCSNIISI